MPAIRDSSPSQSVTVEALQAQSKHKTHSKDVTIQFNVRKNLLKISQFKSNIFKSTEPFSSCTAHRLDAEMLLNLVSECAQHGQKPSIYELSIYQI